MADKVSDRRADSNKFFISLVTGLFALLSAVVALRTPANVQSAVLLTVAILGVSLCYAWYVIIRSYRQLNTAKYAVILDMEKPLPHACYDQEWNILGRGQDKESYLPLTHVAKYVPKLFVVLFIALLFFRRVSAFSLVRPRATQKRRGLLAQVRLRNVLYNNEILQTAL